MGLRTTQEGYRHTGEVTRHRETNSGGFDVAAAQAIGFRLMVEEVARWDSAEPPSFHVEGEEEGYVRSRLPSDLLRLVIALVAGLLGFLLASVLDNISVGITIEVVDAFDGLPTALVVTIILAIQLVAWILPLVVIGLLLFWRRYRRLALVLLAVVAAVAVAWGIQSELTARFAPPELAVEPPSWVCDNLAASTEQGVRADDPGAVGDS